MFPNPQPPLPLLKSYISGFHDFPKNNTQRGKNKSQVDKEHFEFASFFLLCERLHVHLSAMWQEIQPEPRHIAE